MFAYRPSFLKPSKVLQAIPIGHDVPGFVIHPSTSELAEQLMVDPESLSNENYSGLYDESGDYVPQYCDNPEDIPQGMQIDPNRETGAPLGGAPGPNSEKPAEPSKPVDTSE